MRIFKDWLWSAFAGLMALCVAFLGSLPAQADAVANAQTYAGIREAAVQEPARRTQGCEAQDQTIGADRPLRSSRGR